MPLNSDSKMSRKTTFPDGMMSTNPRKELLTTHELHEYLQGSISKSSLRRLRMTGEGPPFIKLGSDRRSKVLYAKADVDAWLELRKQQHTSPGTA